MDFDDDDAHLCGCDRACVCSDRFSWLAVSPTPVYSDAAFAADSLKFTRFHRAAARRPKFPNLNFRSLTQSQFSSQRHEFDSRAASAKLFLARANCEQAEPMKRHDLSTI